MIDNLKKNISKFLCINNNIDIGASANCDKKSSEIFKNIEGAYMTIRKDAVVEIEDLKIISDILSRHCGLNHRGTSDKNSLKCLTDNMIDHISNFASFGTKGELIPFILKIGERLFNKGRIKEAVCTWEDLLKIDPDNEFIHSKLREIMSEYTNALAPQLLADINKIRKKYFIKKLNTINLNPYLPTRKHAGIGFVSGVNHTLWISAASDYVLTYNPIKGTIHKIEFRIPNDHMIAGAVNCAVYDRTFLLLIHKDEYKESRLSQASLSILSPNKEDFIDCISRLKIKNARGISVSKDGTFAVCDIANRNVKVFNSNGSTISTIGEGQRIKAYFRTPSATLFDKHGNLLVCDQDLATIKKFDIKQGKLLWEISYTEKALKGLSLDDDGNCYTVASLTNTLYKINQQGEHVFKVAVPTGCANGVCVLGDHIYVYDITDCSLIDYLIRLPENRKIPQEANFANGLNQQLTNLSD